MTIDYDFRPAEYWPAGDPPPEGIVVAEVLLDSTLSDTFWVEARPADDGGIAYEISDEYESEFVVLPHRSERPLSMRELVGLIDAAEMTSGDLAGGLVFGSLSYNSFQGCGDPAAANYAQVVSELYPDLGAHYEQAALRFVLGG